MSHVFTQPISITWVYLLVLIIGASWFFFWFTRQRVYRIHQDYQVLKREYELLQTQYDSYRDENYHLQQQHQQMIHQQGQLQAKAEYTDTLQHQLNEQRTLLDQALAKQSTLQSEIARLQQQREDDAHQLSELTKTEQRFKETFENLAQQIFEKKSTAMLEQNQQSMTGLLAPLRQQLDNFRQQVQQSYDTESRERHSLKSQVERLSELNQKMSEEAVNLTRALKGDNKQQGNWGEVVLARILEESGLREGHEYRQQVTGKNQQGQIIKPDVVVSLPDHRCVIIDSKVTLVAYERYCRCEDKQAAEKALQEHTRAVRGHINGLGRKNYQTLYGIEGLDFVLLFIPIEAAFQLALQHDPELISLASRQNILLVSPSSLLVALRTVENLWRSEYQQRNVAEIAQRAGRLYDKFCGFVDDLTQVGSQIDKARDSYQGALTKLSSGRGNLIRQAEQLRELQVPTTKQLPEDLSHQQTP